MHHYVDHEDIGYGLFDLKCRDCEFAVRKVETRFVCDIKQSHRIEALESMVETLVGDNTDLLAKADAAAFAVKQGMQDVAERQRKADLELVENSWNESGYEVSMQAFGWLKDLHRQMTNAPLITDDNP